MSIKILFAKEYGWVAKETSKILAEIPNFEIVEILREQSSFDTLQENKFHCVLTYGPHMGSMMPLLKWLKQSQQTSSTLLIWWLNENIPDLEYWNQTKILGQIRIFFDQFLGSKGLVDNNWGQKLGHRYRILMELFWAKSQGIPMLVPTTSKKRSELLCQVGFNSIHVPMAMGRGLIDVFGCDLGLERDIPVIWVGRLPKLRSRRTKILKPLFQALKQRNVNVDIRTKNFQGRHRTEVLNRSKILLNVLRHPQDSVTDRLILGAANKALLISETMVDSVPFEPNKHMIQVPIDKMADTILYYLEHEQERQKIVNEAYKLVMDELTMKNAIETIFQAAGITIANS